MANCPHLVIEPVLGAQTSMMAIQFTFYGFKCVECGKQWDVGNAVDAIRAQAADEKLKTDESTERGQDGTR